MARNLPKGLEGVSVSMGRSRLTEMKLAILLGAAFIVLGLFGVAGSDDADLEPGAGPDSLLAAEPSDTLSPYDQAPGDTLAPGDPPEIPIAYGPDDSLGPQMGDPPGMPDTLGSEDTLDAEAGTASRSAAASEGFPGVTADSTAGETPSSMPAGSTPQAAVADSGAIPVPVPPEGLPEPSVADTGSVASDAPSLHTVPLPPDTVTVGGVRIPVVGTASGESLAGAGDAGFGGRTGPTFWTAGPRLRPDKPAFAEPSELEVAFSEAFADRWDKAADGRTFEAKQATLEDYSNIDIPIKFPDTIGRVIGQGANLNVSGSEKISFGGQTRYQVDEQATEYGTRSKFPTLDMKQHLKIDLTGTVGEKINVMVHHDSEIETPLENRIKLRYDGDEDEIVQKVEMGNTNLSLPGSRFVSYSGQQQGLFGAKMLAKLGALDLTLIASKQEGRTAGASFVGTRSKDSTTIADLNFVRNKYFFMIDPYTRIPGRGFTEVQVYLDDGNGTNNLDTGALPAVALLDPNDPPDTSLWTSEAHVGYYDVLEVNRDYAVDLQTGEIALLKALGDAHSLAVVYRYGDEQVGGVVVDDKLHLKMIRPPRYYMIDYADVWKAPTLALMRKNVYSLGARFISEEQVEVRIFRKGSPRDEELQGDFAYAKILGIDLQDETGAVATAPDWLTDDYADGGRINGELGLLIFPDLRPFEPLISPTGRPAQLEDTNPTIYDEIIDNLKENENSKYYINIRYSTPETSFKLKHINILEGSEVVTLDGRRLTRNVDYEIYYDIGQIRFKTEEAAHPDAEISVDYQYVPFLALAQQSLVGTQGMYKFSDKSHIGSLWLFQSKKSPEERPRLGQEPSQIVMGDVNASFQFNPSVMTTMINALPFVSSKSESRLTMTGEVGISFPNPNTKGEVYIDDMEGVQDLRSFSVMREAWVPASAPTGFRWQDSRRINWYVKDREVREEDLFPKAESKPGESYIPVMEIKYKEPMYEGEGFDTSNEWTGLMRLLSKTGTDYSELRFFEIWLRQKQGDGGILNVDLGAVSENFYRPGDGAVLHTEDTDQDGELSQTENTGLDGVFTEDSTPENPDDPYDNWDYNEGNYSKINGTERNPRIVPDTEDLDDDGNLDMDNVHFRLSFDLADTTYIANRSDEWTLYRVPLVDADTLGGSPSWRSIRYMRLFFTEADTQSVYQVAYMQIAGTSWLEEGIRVKEDMIDADPPGEETFEISAKNTRDDPDYVPPYDPGKDPQGYRKREQSLVMTLRNLAPGHSGSVYKILSGGASNYTLYQTLAFYVYGDAQTADENLHMFVRFGSDSLNFYEYAVRIGSGWRTVKIPLEEITNLKIDEPDTVTLYDTEKQVFFRRTETSDGWIAAYGSPSITRVSRVGVGVVNSGEVPTSGLGVEVWFDDLRLTDVRREAGFAGRFSLGSSFADVATVNLDYEKSDTEFQTLTSNRSGSDDTRYSISVSTALEKLLPITRYSLPCSYRYHKSTSLPTLKSQSDIALKSDQREEERRSSVDDFYRLAISKTRKSKNILMRLTVDALSAGASYSRKRGVSPELADTSSGYSGNIAYKLSPWWKKSLRVFRGYSVSFMPDNVSYTVNGSTKNVKTIDRRLGVVKQDRYSRDIKGNFSVTYTPLSGPMLKTDYRLTMAREMDTNKRVPIIESIGRGRELKRSQSAGVQITPSFGRWMKPTFSYDVDYNENSDPSVRSAGEPRSIRRASMSAKSLVDVMLAPSGTVTMPAASDTVGLSVHELILSKIPDVTMSYVINRVGKYQKILNRPDFAFQFGLDTKVDEDIIYRGSSGAAQKTDEHTRSRGFIMSSDFEPVKHLSMEARFKTDKSKREYAGATSFNASTSWPDVTGNISGLGNLGFLEGTLKSTSFAFGYKGSQTEKGTGSKVNTRTSKTEWLPLVGWDATWNNGLRTTFNLRRSSSETETFTGTGTRKNSSATSVSLSLSHSFSAPQGMYIPLAGRTLKFESNLTLNLDMTYEMRLDKTPTAGNRVDTDERKLGITPRASYSFSKNITGSANARFEQRSDRKLGQTWRTIGLSASVLIRF